MTAPILQFKRGNAGIAGTVPALRPGEPAISLNNFDFFIGIDTSVANNKFFGSHRYWERENETTNEPLKLKLVSDNGSESVNLRAPVGLANTVTYTLPATAIGYSGKVLSTNEDGDLSWIDRIDVLGVEQIVIGIGTFTNNVAFTTTTESTSSTTGAVTIVGGLGVGGTSYFGSDLNVGGDLNVTGTVSFGGGAGADFSGITTFSNTTDNTLGDPDTGAVQIDGGLGVDKNVTIGAGLSVAGDSYFIGTATFYGGQINLGDGGGDIINIDGTISSNLVPTTDATYDVGISTLNWRNAHFSGIGTFEAGVDANDVTIGINAANEINTSTGNLILHSATGVVEVANHLDVIGDLDVTGNVSIGGTTITLRGEEVFIENKDIVLGYTTSVTPSDTTANHAGVAIASTEGAPLVSFTASGINTLPDTYKQMMWFQSGTLGFSTDAFAFNYGVAIGTTTMADGIRLAVGSSITMTDDTINATSANFTNLSATNITGSLTGTISTATRATLIDTTGTSDDATYYVTFVDTSAGEESETLRVGTALAVNASSGNVTSGGDLISGSGYLAASDGTQSLLMADSTGDVTVTGDLTVTGNDIKSSTATVITLSGSDAEFANNVDITGDTTTAQLTIGTGVAVTQFSGSVSTGTSISSVPTSSAVIDYVESQIGAVDLELSINADSGGPSTVNTSQTLTISGTPSEIETSVSGQTITVGLPDAVIVGTSLSAPTIKTATIQHLNGTQAATIDISGNIVASHNLTINGDLYIQGSTTQVNTQTLTVEDRLIESGKVQNSPPSDSTWDVGILFNYYKSSVNKRAGVFWDDSVSRIAFAAETTVTNDFDTTQADPLVSVTTWAPIEVGSLWVNDCAGQSQVISCTGTERFLENITVDAGTF